MEHKMNLNDSPFNKIKSGSKTIELRLNDEKRRLLNVGDTIEFTNRNSFETLLVEIINLYKYENFEELYKDFDKISLGYEEDEEKNYIDMEKYYSKEEQKKYGVLGIHMKVISNEE